MLAKTSPTIIALDARTPMTPWPDFPDSEIAWGSTASSGHFFLEDKTHGLSVGIWEAGANLGRWMDWPCHELMIVLEGTVVLVEHDRETVVGPGQSVFVPKGRRVIWNQPGYLKKLMVLWDHAGIPSMPDMPIVNIDHDAPMEPRDTTPASVLLTAMPEQAVRDIFVDGAGQFVVGLWQSSPYTRACVTSPRHEVMHILEGTVTMTDKAGASQTFSAGDTFLVTMGNDNAWSSDVTVKKIYCSLQPVSAA